MLIYDPVCGVQLPETMADELRCPLCDGDSVAAQVLTWCNFEPEALPGFDDEDADYCRPLAGGMVICRNADCGHAWVLPGPAAEHAPVGDAAAVVLLGDLADAVEGFYGYDIAEAAANGEASAAERDLVQAARAIVSASGGPSRVMVAGDLWGPLVWSEGETYNGRALWWGRGPGGAILGPCWSEAEARAKASAAVHLTGAGAVVP